jgi:hypothetical protein
MKLDRVTITGADDSVSPKDIVALSRHYPFVEFGILFSKRLTNQSFVPRFPSNEWVYELCAEANNNPMHLCAHLCGGWVRDLFAGKATWIERYRDFACPRQSLFRRIQLNFHTERHDITDGFVTALRTISSCAIFTNDRAAKRDIIFQWDGVNDELMACANAAGVSSYPLFDLSGGAGVLPAEWPKPVGEYSGYAGGLGPENMQAQLERIAGVVGDARIWCDMETRVRSNADMRFDLDKVQACLEIAKPFVK